VPTLLKVCPLFSRCFHSRECKDTPRIRDNTLKEWNIERDNKVIKQGKGEWNVEMQE